MLGLVHPCKIYNIFAVGAPVVYVGPRPSHVTEILEQLPGYPQISVQHAQAAELARQIQRMAGEGKGNQRAQPHEILKSFSKAVLLPKLIAALEADKP
jgi:hypothetical protein